MSYNRASNPFACKLKINRHNDTLFTKMTLPGKVSRGKMGLAVYVEQNTPMLNISFDDFILRTKNAIQE
ncbi:Uncharacterised protein [Candidatus Venteria ishoeyi]|uniref:Uncharacterized protein n=1 Tax=Candidatus Venteria ishoeyi TaxID=1899563 RepID=A0A1H6F8F2_9GAMM|nr:Uncharacterised protein [Candidatus Venteria ishoeyi]